MKKDVKKTKRVDHHGIKQKIKAKYPNETIKLLLERGSCRLFKKKKIPKRILRYIIKAGTHAPSGGNLQPFSIIKIENKDTNKKLAELCGNQKWIEDAPVNLLFCIDLYRLKKWAELEVAPFTATNSFTHFWISFQDTVIAAQNISTAADSMGLGSVYIGTITTCFRQLKKMFKLPEGVFPVVLLCLGYPLKKVAVRKKLDIDIIVHDEKYKKLSNDELKNAFNKKYNSIKIEIIPERLDAIERVCKNAHGEKFADKCIKKIKKNGYINMVQYYYGLHYVADMMTAGNEEFLKILKDFGFSFLGENRER